MTAEEMTKEAEKHFAIIRAAIVNRQVAWSEIAPTGFQGAFEGYTLVLVNEHTGATMTTRSLFCVINFTPEMAKFCYGAAVMQKNETQELNNDHFPV